MGVKALDRRLYLIGSGDSERLKAEGLGQLDKVRIIRQVHLAVTFAQEKGPAIGAPSRGIGYPGPPP